MRAAVASSVAVSIALAIGCGKSQQTARQQDVVCEEILDPEAAVRPETSVSCEYLPEADVGDLSIVRNAELPNCE